jgi:hypothetical protein
MHSRMAMKSCWCLRLPAARFRLLGLKSEDSSLRLSGHVTLLLAPQLAGISRGGAPWLGLGMDRFNVL